MNFWKHFFKVLAYKPIQAAAAAYWHLTRRRVRAHNRLRVASADLPFAYSLWIDKNEANAELTDQVGEVVDRWSWHPRFTVMLHGHAGRTAEQLDRSVQTVKNQIYPHWTLVDDSADPIGKAIAARDDYLVPLRVGDRLSKGALFRFAETVQREPRCAVLYGDQDELDASGQRCRPWFKPRWNREMFLAHDYISGAIAIETNLAGRAALTTRSLTELIIEATATDRPVVHVPHILSHVTPEIDDQSERLEAVRRHVSALGATCVAGPFGTIKVEWPLPLQRPLVTIIVPTKDKIDLLAPCVESVLARTDYDHFEILIVDNGSLEKRTADYLARISKNPKLRVLAYPGNYNFSAINNFAARRARGAFLCLLNNDTEVLNAGWLTEMMRYAIREDVGAVGAKLLYEDGSIQHAGVVVGIGDAAGHAHRYLPAQDAGYFRQPHVAQFVSAVTAACLLVEKQKFEAVGGLDEAHLAVAFNDVDFCLKLEKVGWRNIYVPHAVLVHHESKSRGKDFSPANVDRYHRELSVLQERWGTKTYEDPLHNPNLDRYSETFVFRL